MPIHYTNLRIDQNYIYKLIHEGNSYISTTGLVTGPNSTNQTVAYSFFVPSSNTKHILLYSLLAEGGSGSLNRSRSQTVDPAFANAITPVNLNVGSLNTSILANITYANTNQSAVGTEYEPFGLPSNDFRELLVYPVVIPPATAWGIIVYLFLSGANSNWGVTARHAEFIP